MHTFYLLFNRLIYFRSLIPMQLTNRIAKVSIHNNNSHNKRDQQPTPIEMSNSPKYQKTQSRCRSICVKNVGIDSSTSLDSYYSALGLFLPQRKCLEKSKSRLARNWKTLYDLQSYVLTYFVKMKNFMQR